MCHLASVVRVVYHRNKLGNVVAVQAICLGARRTIHISVAAGRSRYCCRCCASLCQSASGVVSRALGRVGGKPDNRGRDIFAVPDGTCCAVLPAVPSVLCYAVYSSPQSAVGRPCLGRLSRLYCSVQQVATTQHIFLPTCAGLAAAAPQRRCLLLCDSAVSPVSGGKPANIRCMFRAFCL